MPCQADETCEQGIRWGPEDAYRSQAGLLGPFAVRCRAISFSPPS